MDFDECLQNSISLFLSIIVISKLLYIAYGIKYISYNSGIINLYSGNNEKFNKLQ